MKKSELAIKKLILKSKDYLENGKHKLEFLIIAVTLSAFAIYTAGKSLGKIIYYIAN